MVEGVVESKEEMKKRMERIKKGEEKGETKEKAEEKLGETKEKTQEKLGDTKEKLKETKEETEEKLGDTKEKLGETKEKTQEKLGETREKTEEKWGDIRGNLEDVKEETASQLKEYQRKSEKEGKNPAEKFLSDIITGILQKTEDVNQAMIERTGTLLTIPLVDVVETEDAITIMADIPSLSKEDIEIGVNQNSVEITANYEEKPSNNEKFIQKERGHGTVHRTIALPTPIDVKKTSASYKNCILTIILPKKREELTKITIPE
jgi:HSP20 family protein